MTTESPAEGLRPQFVFTPEARLRIERGLQREPQPRAVIESVTRFGVRGFAHRLAGGIAFTRGSFPPHAWTPPRYAAAARMGMSWRASAASTSGFIRREAS